MNAEKTKITPSMAEKWLESVPEFQRKIDERQVAKLVLAIQRNEWRENGATIVFNRNGELIDGQHRLKAVVVSGMPIYSLVVKNVPAGEETFHTIGDEKARRVADFIKCKNASSVASALRMYWLVTNRIWPPVGKGANGLSKVAIPTADVLRLGLEHVEYLSGLVQPISLAGKVTGQQSFILFLCFYYTKVHKVDPELIAKFFARVGDGLELKASDPAFLLRKRFLDLRKHGTTSIKPLVAQGLILKALNLHIDGQSATRLVFDPEKEEFPVLYGFKKLKKAPDLETVARSVSESMGEPIRMVASGV